MHEAWKTEPNWPKGTFADGYQPDHVRRSAQTFVLPLAANLTNSRVVGAELWLTNETGVSVLVEFGGMSPVSGLAPGAPGSPGTPAEPDIPNQGLGGFMLPAGVSLGVSEPGVWLSIARLTPNGAPTDPRSRVIVNYDNAYDIPVFA